ncbi:MAG TPA: tetratricopeptide repeat protein [Candidatus Stackebrandtia faecavium]|nr:tetratricopeptide repeat protein [Candidatus Stackebrandtia faecavium]
MTTAPTGQADYGQLLRSYRMRLGLSQATLGRRAAVSPRTIRHLEAGRSYPRAATLHALSVALELPEAERAALVNAATRENQPDPSPAPLTRLPFGVPRQLPAAPPHFTGRDDALARLDAAADDPATPLSIISGPGGVGKTWLGMYWAHRRVADYPDGQIYLNLRGFEPQRSPMSAKDALGQALSSIGVESSTQPRELDARACLFRSLLADRRILLILDNARDDAQLIPLLPGVETCFTIVTSRNKLSSLVTSHGANILNLGTLIDDEVELLLRAELGDARVDAEPAAVAQLIKHCAGLPLAVGIAAARAASHPNFPLSALVEELQDETDRLDALEIDGLSTSLRSVFETSCGPLSPTARRTFALLGMAPRPEISLYAAASLAGDSVAATRKNLRELEASNLIDHYEPERYRMHDLLHLYAGEYCRREYAQSEHDAALRRLVAHYVYTSQNADHCLAPRYQMRYLGKPPADCVCVPMATDVQALRWFTTEHANIVDAQRFAYERGWHDSVWKQAWLLRTFHRWQTRLDSDLSVWQLAADSATQSDDLEARAFSQLHLGAALSNRGQSAEATPHLDSAIALAVQIGDQQSACGAHYVKSLIAQEDGDYEAALRHSVDVLNLANEFGNQDRIAEALNGVGWTRALLGDLDRAREDCERALEIAKDGPHVEDLADVWDSLGFIALKQENYRESLSKYEQALAAYTRVNPHSYHVARVLNRLGDVHAALDEVTEAAQYWRKATECHRMFNRVAQAEPIERKLDAL